MAKPRTSLGSVLITVFAFLILYVPLVVLVVYSFLDQSGSRFTWEWYEQVFQNSSLLEALNVSLWVGLWTTIGSAVIGTAAAIVLERRKVPFQRFIDFLTLLPLITPEIVLGLSLLVWFVVLKITLGAFSIILAHISFSVSYVIVTVRTRIHDFDHSLEEAARDLGANGWQTFWKVTFPLIWPGVLAGALMAFTISFDDFLITFFTAGVGSDTLPLKLYSMIKFVVSPEVNALSTILLAVTFALVLLLSRQLTPRKN